MQTEALSPALGVRVAGIDLCSASLDLVESLRDVLYEHHVVVVSGQQLRAEELQQFGQKWGDLLTHPSGMNRSSPYVQTLASKKGVVGKGYSAWHSDMTWHPTPPAITMLHGRICPSWGGDTGYANQVMAWEALDKAAKDRGRSFRRELPTQDELYELRALHSGRRFGEDVPSSVHPVVRTHDATGRKALYVNPEFTVTIDGLEEEAGRRILWPLWMHATSMEFVYRHRWTAGDLVIWDNRSVMHTAILDYDSERFMRRVVVAGQSPA